MTYTIINVGDPVYGIDRTGAVDVREKLQDLINDASRNFNLDVEAIEGKGVQLYFPAGIYRIDGPLYLCEDNANPDFNKYFLHQGRIMFIGSGCGDYANATYDATNYSGTVLKFTSSSEDGLIFSTWNDQAHASRNMVIMDMAIYGQTSGHLVKIYQTNTNTTLERMVILNNGGGAALFLSSVWNMIFRSIYVLGNNIGSGIQFRIDETYDIGGGNQLFQDVTASKFDVAFDFGNLFSTNVESSYKNITLISCRGINSRIGMRLRAGISGLLAINQELQGNAGASGRDLEISDSAGFDIAGTSIRCGNISFMGGNFASTDTSIGFVTVQIGRDLNAGDNTRSGAVGPVKFQGIIWNFVKYYAIKRINNTYSESLIIDSCSFHNNGGSIALINDVEQNGHLLFTGQISTDITKDHFVVDSFGKDISCRANFYVPGFNQSMSGSSIKMDDSINLRSNTGNILEFSPVPIKQISTPVDSMVIYLRFRMAMEITSNAVVDSGYSSIILAGGNSFTATPGCNLALVYDKATDSWLELSRSLT